MSTRVYEPSQWGTKIIIAKLENGKIYDETHNFSSLYIADVVDDKVYEVGNWGRQPWRFITKGDTIYESKSALSTYETPLYVARNGFIYEYKNYANRNVVAEYSGDASEALQCYVALVYFTDYTKKENQPIDNKENLYTGTYSSSKGSSHNNTASMPAGGTLGVILLLILVVGFFGFCAQHKEYLCLIWFIILPAIPLIITSVITLISNIFCTSSNTKSSKESDFSILGFIFGFIKGFAIMFVYTLFVNAFTHKYCDIQVVEEGFCIISGFVISCITWALASSKKD